MVGSQEEINETAQGFGTITHSDVVSREKAIQLEMQRQRMLSWHQQQQQHQHQQQQQQHYHHSQEVSQERRSQHRTFSQPLFPTSASAVHADGPFLQPVRLHSTSTPAVQPTGLGQYMHGLPVAMEATPAEADPSSSYHPTVPTQEQPQPQQQASPLHISRPVSHQGPIQSPVSTTWQQQQQQHQSVNPQMSLSYTANVPSPSMSTPRASSSTLPNSQSQMGTWNSSLQGANLYPDQGQSYPMASGELAVPYLNTMYDRERVSPSTSMPYGGYSTSEPTGGSTSSTLLSYMDEGSRRYAASGVPHSTTPSYSVYPSGLVQRASFSTIGSEDLPNRSPTTPLSAPQATMPISHHSPFAYHPGQHAYYDPYIAGGGATAMPLPPPNPPLDYPTPQRDPQRRAATACNFCRARKLRCDGSVPCRQCERRHLDCVFSQGSSRRRKRDSNKDNEGDDGGDGETRDDRDSTSSQSQLTGGMTSQYSVRQRGSPSSEYNQSTSTRRNSDWQRGLELSDREELEEVREKEREQQQQQQQQQKRKKKMSNIHLWSLSSSSSLPPSSNFDLEPMPNKRKFGHDGRELPDLEASEGQLQHLSQHHRGFSQLHHHQPLFNTDFSSFSPTPWARTESFAYT